MPSSAPGSPTLENLVRLAGSSAALAEIAPDLTPGGSVALAPPGPVAPAAPPELAGHAPEASYLRQEGFAVLRGAARPAVCAALVHGIEALRARELPATFVYAFAEAWAIGESARRHIGALLGRDYRLVEDVWAWHVAPGTGRGWPPHRGIAHERLDRDAPEIINVWVALGDVTAERACMHAVPLDDDPGYPDALDRLDAPLTAVRALPAAAGDALFWNANVLHWGGRCAARAVGPRVSCSFTLCRADAVDRFPDLVLLSPLEELDLAARMDAVARMILLYGGPDRGDVRGVVRDWAALTHELASRFGVRKAP